MYYIEQIREAFTKKKRTGNRLFINGVRKEKKVLGRKTKYIKSLSIVKKSWREKENKVCYREEVTK